MKPSKMRNRQIWQASHSTRSRQLGAALSPDLRSRHSRRSVRVVAGDTVRVVRGEYKDVEGHVSRVFTLGGRIAIEGVKKEKGKGEKFDVQIHSTNVVVTSLNGDDSRRMARIRGERGAGSPAPAAARPAGKAPEPAADAATSTKYWPGGSRYDPPASTPSAGKAASPKGAGTVGGGAAGAAGKAEAKKAPGEAKGEAKGEKAAGEGKAEAKGEKAAGEGKAEAKAGGKKPREADA